MPKEIIRYNYDKYIQFNVYLNKNCKKGKENFG